MLRSWWRSSSRSRPRATSSSKRSEITVSSAAIDDRSRILASLLRGFRVLECNKSIALGSAGEFIGDDNRLQDLTELLEVISHRFLRSLPSQTSDEDLRQRSVAEQTCIIVAHHRRSGRDSGEKKTVEMKKAWKETKNGGGEEEEGII